MYKHNYFFTVNKIFLTLMKNEDCVILFTGVG